MQILHFGYEYFVKELRGLALQMIPFAKMISMIELDDKGTIPSHLIAQTLKASYLCLERKQYTWLRGADTRSVDQNCTDNRGKVIWTPSLPKDGYQ